jgi:hypothetical protein
MTLQDTLDELHAYVPSYDEHEDVARLQALTDRLETIEQVHAAIPALLRVFERFPGALLDSPGPVVHCIERCGLETFLPMLLQSFLTRPTRMTLWMVERCLRQILRDSRAFPCSTRWARSARYPRAWNLVATSVRSSTSMA